MQPCSLRSRYRGLVVLVLVLGVPLCSAFASKGEADRERAARLIQELASASGPSASAVAGPLTQARHALGRADSARAAGDPSHAQMLEAVAREWAELAGDVRQALGAEQKAQSQQGAAADAIKQNRRDRAMLEELLERRARMQAELEQLRQSGAPYGSVVSSAVPSPPKASGRGAASAAAGSVSPPAQTRPTTSGSAAGARRSP